MKAPALGRVFVGLSGGVDSSLAARLLLKQGYEVVGVHMKNWSANIGDWRCPWREDYLAAKNLAAFLNIEFKLFDFQQQYKQLVVDYMIDEYKQGNTPNPDIRCNEAVKFKLFTDACFDQGADFVATGHYARIKAGRLCRARDAIKDQTYFLYRVNPGIFNQLLFPLGGLLKKKTRELAAAAGLPTADRPESMGICFVGQVGLTDFLRQYVEVAPGPLINETGEIVGQHEGALFYTLGQRHGLNLSGGLPYYVVGKDMTKNEVYVSRDLNSPRLWSASLNLRHTHWLAAAEIGRTYELRVRHGGRLLPATLVATDPSTRAATVSLAQSARAVSPGQSAVLYDDATVLGGGIIA